MTAPLHVTSARPRNVLFRLDEGGLATSIVSLLRDEVVLAGFFRASGVIADVALRTVDPRGAASASRRLSGTFHLVSLEGVVGLEGGDVTCGLHAVLAREGERGLETVAGEIVDARIVAIEGIITALDDVTATRARAAGGLGLLASATAEAQAAAPSAPALPAALPAPAPSAPALPPSAPALPAEPATWAEAARVSEESARPAPPPPPAPAPARPPPPAASGYTATAMPKKPARPSTNFEEEHVYPDAGDVVEHFAFGRCEVLKSDGDRLHLRIGKDGRVKEIALEMLKIAPLPLEEGQTGKRYRLDRKL